MTSQQRSSKHVLTLSACFILGPVAWSQATSSPQNHAQQVQFSEREHGNVAAQQSAGSGGDGVSTVQSSVTVSGRYSGSVPDPSVVGSILLSFEDAVQRGIRFNLGGVTASNQENLTRGQRLAALSTFLPNINGTISETVQQTYLPAVGITADTLGLGNALRVPGVTGQYHYYTAQGTLSQNAFDLTAFHNLRASQAAQAAAHLSARDAHEVVVLGVGGLYLQALAAQALVQSQQQEVALAAASYKQADAQKTAGTRAPIDANRSLVELRTEQQRLTSDIAELQKQTIRLARVIGLSPGTDITLTGKLPETVPPVGSVEDEIARGEAGRFDLKSAEADMQAALQAVKAARAEYLPTATLSGAYGIQGNSFGTGRIAYNGVASINIPVFQSGRVRGDTTQAEATLAQRRSEYADQKDAVEADVRSAMIDLSVASQQVAVARDNRVLANDNLRQSQDRFVAGVTDSVEVVQSQQSLAAADRDYINSLYSLSLARLRTAQATGVAEQEFHSLLGTGEQK